MSKGGNEVSDCVDYKEMYLKMVRATEAAMQILVQAQIECEELYLSAPEEAQIIEIPKLVQTPDES